MVKQPQPSVVVARGWSFSRIQLSSLWDHHPGLDQPCATLSFCPLSIPKVCLSQRLDILSRRVCGCIPLATPSRSRGYGDRLGHCMACLHNGPCSAHRLRVVDDQKLPRCIPCVVSGSLDPSSGIYPQIGPRSYAVDVPGIFSSILRSRCQGLFLDGFHGVIHRPGIDECLRCIRTYPRKSTKTSCFTCQYFYAHSGCCSGIHQTRK